MKKQQGLWPLHMAVLLFGLSGLFGKVICQHSLVITWGRVVFTALSHTLFIGSLRTIRTQTASVVSCLEPVYGILLAALFLGEIPSLREVLGGAVVFACAIWGSLKKEA